MNNKIAAAMLAVATVIAVVAVGSNLSPNVSSSAAAAIPPAINMHASAAPAGAAGLKTVQIVDPMFNMVANTMSIPNDWQFEGTILHGPGCGGGDYNGTAFRAYSKDMRYGIQLLPSVPFVWADDSRALPKGPACKALQPLSAADYGKFISLRIRPNSVIDSVEADPYESDFQADIVKMNQSLARMCAQQRGTAMRGNQPPSCPSYKGESKIVEIHYDLNGHPEEEYLTVQMLVETQPTTISAPATTRGQVFQILTRNVIISSATVTALRAPRGEMKSAFPKYASITKSFNVNQDYLAKFTAFEQNQTNRRIAASWQTFHSMMQQSDEQMAQMRANAQQEIKNMQAQGDARRDQFEQNMADRSGHARDVSDYLLDQQYYVNPTTGQTSTEGNGYNHTFSDGGKGVVQTNDPNYNPNGKISGNWTELQPIHH